YPWQECRLHRAQRQSPGRHHERAQDRQGLPARGRSAAGPVCRTLAGFIQHHDEHTLIFKEALMSRSKWLSSFALATALSLGGAAAQGQTLYEGARLITGDGSVIENSAFVVQGTLFSQVGRKGEVPLPAGGTRVDLTGKTVMPTL